MVERPDPKLGGFEPYNDAHAIVVCGLNVAFAGILGGEQWLALRKAAIVAARDLDLGSPQPFYGYTLSFDGVTAALSLNAPHPATNEVSGITFFLVDEDDKPKERVIVARDGILFYAHAYVRWAPFFDRVTRLVKAVLPAYAAHLICHQIKLEYWDRFDARIASAEADVTKLLQTEGGFIPRASVSPTEPWHSHTGYFTRVSDTVRRLLNLRLDLGDFPTREATIKRSLTIYTAVTDSLNAPGYDPKHTGFSEQEILDTLTGQHQALKDFLVKIISPQAAARIGLQKQ